MKGLGKRSCTTYPKFEFYCNIPLQLAGGAQAVKIANKMMSEWM
jgi:hypothetical protein